VSYARDVLVVVGAGCMGTAVAERLGAGRTVLLGDRDEEVLEAAARRLEDAAYDVVAEPVDVTDGASVRRFARLAGDLGPVRQLAHAVGVTPGTASVELILRVNLLGCARVLEEFETVVATGGSAVVVAGVAAHQGRHDMTPDQELALALVPADELLEMSCTHPAAFPDRQTAYAFTKHANRMRVRAASTR
jgi:meso-butanediol dehydrogenase/(S,S)-butanediol dehydrogenase/diacetyl reductase